MSKLCQILLPCGSISTYSIVQFLDGIPWSVYMKKNVLNVEIDKCSTMRFYKSSYIIMIVNAILKSFRGDQRQFIFQSVSHIENKGLCIQKFGTKCVILV